MSATSRACPATSQSRLPRAYQIGRPAVCCGVVLPVCPCVGVVLQSPRAHHARLVTDTVERSYPRSILLRHFRHARFRRDLLATSSRGCHGDATRKTASVESELYRPASSSSRIVLSDINGGGDRYTKRHGCVSTMYTGRLRAARFRRAAESGPSLLAPRARAQSTRRRRRLGRLCRRRRRRRSPVVVVGVARPRRR